jgi:hypothetical protein
MPPGEATISNWETDDDKEVIRLTWKIIW